MKIFLFVFVLIIKFLNNGIAQKNFSKDSVIQIIYTENVNLDGRKYSNSVKLISNDTISYYFISNPQFELEDQRPFAAIIKNKNCKCLYFDQPMVPKYDRNNYFSDSLFPMKWIITNESRVFNGRVGYKAFTNFRGRIFTAYYDPKIPINDGPFKFGGLPGLIIKLYDNDRIWDYELSSLNKILNRFRPNKINIAGDYGFYKEVYPPWRKKYEASVRATKNIDPNCIDCNKSVSKSYTIELIPGFDINE